MRRTIRVLAAGLLLPLAPALKAQPVVAVDGVASPAARCAALAHGHRGEIDRATFVATGTDAHGAPLPAHCEVYGALERRTGQDGQHYAIGFHLRLPADWNGRFFFQGGGGSDGVIGDALGNLQGDQPRNALQLGYAVVSTDAGHSNETNDRPDAGGVLSFGLDQRARENYAGRAQAVTTVAAKALLTDYYGRGPVHSYFVGCSKGGQEGMAMSQRYPDYFDGIMANAPGFALPRAALAQVWDTQALAGAAKALGRIGEGGLPLLGAAFPQGDLALVNKAVLDACDGLDGVRDGIVGRFGACTTARVAPVLQRLACAGAKTDACLAPAQLAAIRAVFAGGTDRAGRPLYSDWAWDAGLGPNGGRDFTGWRAWKLGAADAPVPDARNVVLGGGSVAYVFGTPPARIGATPMELYRYELGYDLPRDAGRMSATAPAFPLSSWVLLAANSDDRTAFRRHGGKLIVVHGASDPVFSLNDTARWWTRLDRRAGGHAADFARVFPVPGMNHCRGGPGTTRFDAFSALVGWVERGRAPASIEAEAPKESPWPGRTRPLCVFPAYARYDGRGSVERAASFECVAN